MPDLSEESPRTLRRERERELRRADLLAVATAVFAERGFEGAQVSEIASRAEVSLATLYGAFGSKEELYQAVIREVSLGMLARVEERVQDIEDPVECVLAAVDALCLTFESERGFLHLFLRDGTAMPWKVRQNLGEEGSAIFQEFADWIADPARRAQEDGRLVAMTPEALAVFVLGGVATTLTRAVENDPDASLLELGAELRAGVARLFEPEASP